MLFVSSDHHSDEDVFCSLVLKAGSSRWLAGYRWQCESLTPDFVELRLSIPNIADVDTQIRHAEEGDIYRNRLMTTSILLADDEVPRQVCDAVREDLQLSECKTQTSVTVRSLIARTHELTQFFVFDKEYTAFYVPSVEQTKTRLLDCPSTLSNDDMHAFRLPFLITNVYTDGINLLLCQSFSENLDLRDLCGQPSTGPLLDLAKKFVMHTGYVRKMAFTKRYAMTTYLSSVLLSVDESEEVRPHDIGVGKRCLAATFFTHQNSIVCANILALELDTTSTYRGGIWENASRVNLVHYQVDSHAVIAKQNMPCACPATSNTKADICTRPRFRGQAAAVLVVLRDTQSHLQLFHFVDAETKDSNEGNQILSAAGGAVAFEAVIIHIAWRAPFFVAVTADKHVLCLNDKLQVWKKLQVFNTNRYYPTESIVSVVFTLDHLVVTWDHYVLVLPDPTITNLEAPDEAQDKPSEQTPDEEETLTEDQNLDF
jgi:hypothetical protein